MQNRTSLVAEQEVIRTFKLLANAYEEISVVRMQRVRSSVLSTRSFLELLSEIFFDVKSNYKREIIQLLAQKKNKGKLSFTTANKNGKSVAVFLSANTKLYGDIVFRVYNLFVDTALKSKSDIVIVGRVGRELFEQGHKGQKYTYFDLADTSVGYKEVEPLVKLLLEYEKVNVFYGRFANVITQVPSVVNVSGEDAMNIESDTSSSVKYLFEPSLEEILAFFENQVFVSLFKQTVHEGELARLASRIRAMETALLTIEQSEGKLKNDIRRANKLIQNKKQLSSFSGISLWYKK